jgi:hypothetical protein
MVKSQHRVNWLLFIFGEPQLEKLLQKSLDSIAERLENFNSHLQAKSYYQLVKMINTQLQFMIGLHKQNFVIQLLTRHKYMMQRGVQMKTHFIL